MGCSWPRARTALADCSNVLQFKGCLSTWFVDERGSYAFLCLITSSSTLMKKFRFSLRTLLIAAPALAIAAVGLIRFIDVTTVLDVTHRGPSTCEIHNVAMTKKLVGITYGMRMATPTDDARRRLFPHADEVYDTGYCMATQQNRARVYVCSRCSKARARWQGRNGK